MSSLKRFFSKSPAAEERRGEKLSCGDSASHNHRAIDVLPLMRRASLSMKIERIKNTLMDKAKKCQDLKKLTRRPGKTFEEAYSRIATNLTQILTIGLIRN